MKYTEKLAEIVRNNISLNNDNLQLVDGYARVKIEMVVDGKMLSIPLSHVVWLLSNGRWPYDGMHIHHRDDDPLNNTISNLEEVSPRDNHSYRLGKSNGRYGQGKYGYGISITYQKKEDYYAIHRNLSPEELPYQKGWSRNEYKAKRHRYIGGAKTKEEAEEKIRKYIENIGKDPLDTLF